MNPIKCDLTHFYIHFHYNLLVRVVLTVLAFRLYASQPVRQASVYCTAKGKAGGRGVLKDIQAANMYSIYNLHSYVYFNNTVFSLVNVL